MKMNNKRLYYSSVASTMSLILAAVAPAPVSAQDSASSDAEFEEIVVTGIRSSLKQAMDVKRDARGVVDAISAEDMGKFPDTNLAESLQRITGVSIDRVNGEGSRVTVRGFGGDFNLVTLNGRQMPVSSLADQAASDSRSFDFANIASEGIAAVQVYKTGKAHLATGGIGSTINVQTTRPLNAPGFKASIGAKAVLDTSDYRGTKTTPEISGVISNTFADDKFGIALSGSYQNRKGGLRQFGSDEAHHANTGITNGWGTVQNALPGLITNAPGETDVYGTPQNPGYRLTTFERTRYNGQLTMQWRPIDTVTVTGDYTYSRNTTDTTRTNMSIWFNHNPNFVTAAFTDGPVAGLLNYGERFDQATVIDANGNAGQGNTDFSYGAAAFSRRNENHSIGFNVEWQATDNLTIEADYHNSSAESGAGDSPYGTEAVVSTAGINLSSQSVDYSGDLPILSATFDPGPSGINGPDPSLVQATGSVFRNSYMRQDVEQAQLKAKWEFDEGIVESIDFGAAWVETDVRTAFGVNQNNDWGGAVDVNGVAVGVDAIPDDLFTSVQLTGLFDAFDNGDQVFPEMLVVDVDRFIALLDGPDIQRCGGDGICNDAPFTTDRRLTETNYSAYAQINTSFEMAEMPVNFTAGLRYEKTDTFSESLVPDAVGTQYTGNNQFNIIVGSDQVFDSGTGEYSKWLPNVDFDIQPMENVIFRASYSHTITRPGWNSLLGGTTLANSFRQSGGTGNSGDPDLDPFLSKNIDFSLEWYYGDASYISAGWFQKDVKNFIGLTTTNGNFFGLTHPGQGPRFQDAISSGIDPTNETAIRNYIFANYPDSSTITGTDTAGNTIGSIDGLSEDPLVNFQITVPANTEDATLKGWEFALQHTFWDTGFGVIVNYTDVSSDALYDNTIINTVPQFALVGLSDSANFIGFYDKDGIQARVAYNWRDEFLSATTTLRPGTNPQYTAAYGQWDVNVSYDVTDQLTVFVEALNLTNSTQKISDRHPNNVIFANQQGPRYNIGARYTF